MSADNFDPAEINKFSKDHNDWWNSEGMFKTLHDINPVRLDYICSFADLADKQVLDIGCGGGILATAMAEQGAQVTAIDKAGPALEAAREEAKKRELDINYRDIAVEELVDETSSQYDVITCLEMLEHVPDPASIVKQIMLLLKPGGKLVVSTLNRNTISFVGGIVVAEYLLRLLPRGTHSWQKFIKPSELCQWLEDAGANINDISGMFYNPLTRSATLTSRPHINYLVCASTDHSSS